MKAQILFETAVQKQLSNDLVGAKTLYQKLLKQYPTNSEVLSNLGTIVKRQGQLAAAEQLLKRALQANPNNIAALTTMGNICLGQKRIGESFNYTLRALKIDNQHPESLVNLGVAFARENQIRNAEVAFNKALAVRPNFGLAKMNLANCHRLLKIDLAHSIDELKSVTEKEPENDEAWLFLSMAHLDNMQYVKSLDAITRAHETSGKYEYINTRAAILIILGEFEEAMSFYRDALKFEPGNNEISATILFALNYDNRKTAEEVFQEYKSYGATFKSHKKYTHENHLSSKDRKIRIGYSSADFYGHVVMFFMEPILRSHNKEQFELVAFSNVSKPDNVTERVQRIFNEWVDVSNMTNQDMAQSIYDKKIDIMVDLSGHTTGTRLESLCSKPAPIQCTYLGYGYTTGMTDIDYFIGDSNFTPEGCEHLFSEQVFRIPAPVYAYESPTAMTPQVAKLPALKKGYVTFGSMSRIIRFNNQLLRVWKQVLDRVPGSKLRLDQKPFGDPDTCERFSARLERLGFQADQFELVSSKSHWLGYHDFDISLDCWPHNAGTTTFEALWMGVPVISKRDRPSVGRLSAMVLEPLGLGDWIADTEEEFVDKAVAMASDLDGLERIRAGLRKIIQESPFMDFKARTKGLEDAYVEMMRRFEEKKA
ncbi:MAG: tetratricopeptide repeat protein [Rhabdaerophilum sp.]